MKFTPDNIKAYRTDYGYYSQYAIMSPQSTTDGKICGPGIEAKLIHPTSDFILPEDYNYDGWDRLFRAPQFDNGYIICPGVGINNNQLPLFNLYQTFSIWRSVHSHTDFRKYVACIIGITYLDMIYRFGSKTVVDKSLSLSAQPLIDGFHETGLGPRPNKIDTNNRDKEFNYDEYVVYVDSKRSEEIDQNYLYFGHMGFKYEMNRLSSNPPDLESPRWWRQREIKKLELSDIVCDNQIVLF